jgi:cbb3-type cytochrome oxidase subunit 1
MFSSVLSRIHFWGWQAIIVAAAVTLPLGFTTSKESAELEWPIDIAIALLVVTCPCALGLATPLAIVAALAARRPRWPRRTCT